MPDTTKASTLLFEKETQRGMVTVWQEKRHRWLSIDDILQTKIVLDRPEELLSVLHHSFLAALLFVDKPGRVLLAGLGGGALARYLSHVDTSVQGDAIELCSTVTEVSSQYFDVPEKNWSVHNKDIRHWDGQNYDLIVSDIADAGTTPLWLTSEKMLKQFRFQLSEKGVLVINLLIEDVASFRDVLIRLRKIFNKQTLCLSVPEHKNIVVFAFNHEVEHHSEHDMNAQISALSTYWNLDFRSMFNRLKKDNPVGSGVF